MLKMKTWRISVSKLNPFIETPLETRQYEIKARTKMGAVKKFSNALFAAARGTSRLDVYFVTSITRI